MESTRTEIDGVWTIEPKVLNDDRGYLFESFKQSESDKGAGYHADFIQDSESKSSHGILRGLHYQEGDTAQAELVCVTKGKVVDVAVDLRKSLPTSGEHVMVKLSDKNKCQFFVPRSFAHGFLALSDEAILIYKMDNAYSPQTEASPRQNDEAVVIKWPINAKDIILLDKDLNKGLSLKGARVFE